MWKIVIYLLYLLHNLIFLFQKKSTHYLMMKIHNERELKSIAINHLADIDYKHFLKIYKKCTSEAYSFLTIDTALPADDI